MDLITGVMMASIAVLLGYIFTGINVFTVVLAPLVLWMLYFPDLGHKSSTNAYITRF